MRLERLHEQFIAMANRPMEFGALPVVPLRPSAPVIAVDRWKEAGGAIYKTYRFRRPEDRNDFIIQLLAYEARVEHHGQIRIEEGSVELKLSTKDVSRVTALDKEYARYADVLFKELVYSPRHADEG